MARRRIYPHLEQVKDRPVQQALRLLIDRTFQDGDDLDTLTTRVATCETSLTMVPVVERDSREHKDLIQELFSTNQQLRTEINSLKTRVQDLEDAAP